MPTGSSELVVFLTAQTAQFKGKMDEAGAEVATLNRTGSSNFQKFNAVGTAALIGIGVAAVAGGVVAVKAAMQFETAHTRLTTAIKNSGSTFAAHRGQIDQLDSKMRDLGFTDTETENGMARLVTATKNVSLSTKLMGLAADIARARHLDLGTATDMLVKVEGRRYLALSKTLGVSKEVIAGFKNEGDAVKYLTDRFGGQGAAYADTFAGKIDRLKAAGDHLAVGFGQALIPVVLGVAEAMASAGGFIADHTATMLALEVAVGALVTALAGLAIFKVLSIAVSAASAAFSFFAGVIATVTSVTEIARIATTAYLVTMEALSGPIGAAILVVMGLVAAFKVFGDQGNRVSVDVGKMTDAMRNNGAEFTQQLIVLDQMGERHKFFQEVLKKSVTGAQQFMAANQAAGYSTAGWDAEIKKQIQNLRDHKQVADSDSQSVTDATAAAERAAGGMRALTQGFKDATNAAKQFKDAEDILAGKNIDFQLSTLQLEDKTRALGAQIRATSGDLRENTDAGNKNREDILQLVQAQNANVEAYYAQSGSIKGANMLLAAHEDQLYQVVRATGMSDAQALVYIMDLYRVPPDVRTAIHNNAELAAYLVQNYKGWIDAVPPTKTTTFYVNTNSALAGLENLQRAMVSFGAPRQVNPFTGKPMAAGGSIAAGIMHLVGERGPELFIPNTSGTLVPNDQLASRGGSAIGGVGDTTTINLTVQGSVVTDRQLVDAVHEGLLRKQRMSGSLRFN